MTVNLTTSFFCSSKKKLEVRDPAQARLTARHRNDPAYLQNPALSSHHLLRSNKNRSISNFATFQRPQHQATTAAAATTTTTAPNLADFRSCRHRPNGPLAFPRSPRQRNQSRPVFLGSSPSLARQQCRVWTRCAAAHPTESRTRLEATRI